jgi:SpoVK/Ycf46/Vps4 family AAA+-type ATPase
MTSNLQNEFDAAAGANMFVVPPEINAVVLTLRSTTFANDKKIVGEVTALQKSESPQEVKLHIENIIDALRVYDFDVKLTEESKAFIEACLKLHDVVFPPEGGGEDTCIEAVKNTGFLFKDLSGMTKEKNQLLSKFVYPTKFKNLFRSKAKGILFYGPPGTGKTSLAKAAVGEFAANAIFFEATPANMKGMYVGQTEKNIENVFRCAKKYLDENADQLAVIFFDEFEALAADRGGSASSDAADSRAVPMLLQMMQGIGGRSERLIVMAATNYISQIDKAILRRFPTQIFVDLPDESSRLQMIYTSLAKNYSLPDLKYSQVRRTEAGGFKFDFTIMGEEEVKSSDMEFLHWMCLFGPDISEGLLSSKPKSFHDRLEYWTNKLKQLAVMTGPSNGKSLISQRNEKGGNSAVGYSSSDIENIMEALVVEDAFRWICMKDGPLTPTAMFAHVKFRPYESAPKGTWTDDYFVATERNMGDLRDTIQTTFLADRVMFVSNDLVPCSTLMTLTGYESKVLSFGLRAQEIETKINSHTPTIDSVDKYNEYTSKPKAS